MALPLAANALAAGVTAADAVDAPASPIPLAASVSVPAPAADPRPEAKREQKPKPATPSPAKPAAPAGQPLAPASQREAGQGLKPGAGDYGPTRAGDTLSEIDSTFVDDRHTLNQAMLAFLRANPDRKGTRLKTRHYSTDSK